MLKWDDVKKILDEVAENREKVSTSDLELEKRGRPIVFEKQRVDVANRTRAGVIQEIHNKLITKELESIDPNWDKRQEKK